MPSHKSTTQVSSSRHRGSRSRSRHSSSYSRSTVKKSRDKRHASRSRSRSRSNSKGFVPRLGSSKRQVSKLRSRSRQGLKSRSRSASKSRSRSGSSHGSHKRQGSKSRLRKSHSRSKSRPTLRKSPYPYRLSSSTLPFQRTVQGIVQRVQQEVKDRHSDRIPLYSEYNTVHMLFDRIQDDLMARIINKYPVASTIQLTMELTRGHHVNVDATIQDYDKDLIVVTIKDNTWLFENTEFNMLSQTIYLKRKWNSVTMDIIYTGNISVIHEELDPVYSKSRQLHSVVFHPF